ncbi:Soluble starch synthase 1, chloroplastic/amyloplastic [Glycine soja]|nr:hypothetical protein JHK87_009759 [Glycine soja]
MSLSSSSNGYDVPWVEKYRPSKVAIIVSYEDAVSRLQVIARDNNMPNLILSFSILDDFLLIYPFTFGYRGIDVVRNKIKMFAQKKVTLSLGRHKIVILDEADSNLGLPPEWYRALGWVFPAWARTHSLDTGEAVNFLKGVVVIADRIVTAKCKISLQKELGLPVRPDYPMKGIDLIRLAMLELMEDGVQFVMLGLGNSIYEDWMSATKSAYKDKFRGWVGFNVPISHKITARLNQLYAMRYGTIPVVHETGGLRDTVHNLNPYTEESKAESTGYVVHEL